MKAPLKGVSEKIEEFLTEEDNMEETLNARRMEVNIQSRSLKGD
jgi:hypothetical protein